MFAKLGMTLIELLVTLSIVVILAVAAIPTFLSLVSNRRLASIGENLYSHVQNARYEAVKRNANVYLSFIPGVNWCYGLKNGGTCNCTIPNDCTLGTESADNSQTTLSITGFPANYVYFEGTHGAANASGTITFANASGSPSISVIVARMGSLKLCADNLSGYPSC